MTIINLRDFYYWYTQDEYMEVSDDVAEALRASVRYEAAYTERARYNKAYYSLDADDGIEYLHDGEADKENPVAVLGSPCCQDFIQQAGVHDLCRIADQKPEHCLWERHTGRQGRTGYHKFTIHCVVSSFWLVWIDNGGSQS
jgi:hypothetical protein